MSEDHRTPAPSDLQLSPLQEARTCPHCGVVFAVLRRIKKVCCSKSCSRQKHAAEAALGLKRMPGRKATGRNAPCEICGETIYVKAWQDNLGFGRFCSRACKDVWWARNGRNEACEWCGTVMRLRPSSKRRFCSWDCQKEGRRTNALDRVHNGRRVHRDSHGYIRVWQPDHPNSYEGWVLEHRWVVEQQLGRFLTREEQIHHINGMKDDNRPENLQLVSAVEHHAITTAESVARRQAEKAELEAYRSKFGPLPQDS